MAEMIFNHPEFKPTEADSKLIETNQEKIIRIEYPDGVIAQFFMTLDGKINVQCNRSFIIDREINGIIEVRPNLYDVNHDFVDALLQ